MVIYLGLGGAVVFTGFFLAAPIAELFNIPSNYHADFIFALKLTFLSFVFSFPSLPVDLFGSDCFSRAGGGDGCF